MSSDWGVSDNNRRARFYQLIWAGELQLAAEIDRQRGAVAGWGMPLTPTLVPRRCV